MNLETKLFVYWLFLLALSYVIARIDYISSGTGYQFKKYDSWTVAVYCVIKDLGIFAIVAIGFVQMTSYFFTGEFQPFP